MSTLSEPTGRAADVLAFVEALDVAQGTLRAIGDRALSDLGGGITSTQFRLLERLQRLGESRLIDLAEVLSIAPSTATRLCDTLAERQVIVRHRRGRDRRELQIRLTDAGTRLVSAVHERTTADWERALGRLSKEDLNHVARVLGALLDADTDVGTDTGATGSAHFAGNAQEISA